MHLSQTLVFSFFSRTKDTTAVEPTPLCLCLVFLNIQVSSCIRLFLSQVIPFHKFPPWEAFQWKTSPCKKITPMWMPSPPYRTVLSFGRASHFVLFHIILSFAHVLLYETHHPTYVSAQPWAKDTPLHSCLWICLFVGAQASCFDPSLYEWFNGSHPL